MSRLAPSRAATPEQLAAAANAALRGETLNTGRLSVTAGATSTLLLDARCGKGRVLVLIPASAAAAALKWWVQAMDNGSATIGHDAPGANVDFTYAIQGIGNT